VNSKPGISGLWANVAISLLGFGLLPVLQKAAIVRGVEPLMAAEITLVFAALTNLTLLLASRLPLRALLQRQHVGGLIVMGLLGSAAVTLLVTHALAITTATNRSLFLAAYPAATLVFARVMLGEQLQARQYLAILIVMTGLVLVNSNGSGVRLGLGFWLLAATLPLIGFTDAYAKHLIKGLDPSMLVAGRNFYGALIMLVAIPWMVLGEWPDALEWMLLIGAGVALAFGGWGLYRAFQYDQASLVAALVGTAPILTLAAESTLLEISLGPWQWFGVIAVIGSGIWLGRNRRPS